MRTSNACLLSAQTINGGTNAQSDASRRAGSGSYLAGQKSRLSSPERGSQHPGNHKRVVQS